MENRKELKFRYEIWKMPEWDGIKWEISRMEWKNFFYTSIPIPYQILCIAFTEKYIPMSVIVINNKMVINNIVTEVYNFNIYAYYLSTNRGTLVVYIAQTVYVLHHCKYVAICSIDIIVRVSQRKFSRGYEGRYRAPKSCWAPKPYQGPCY